MTRTIPLISLVMHPRTFARAKDTQRVGPDLNATLTYELSICPPLAYGVQIGRSPKGHQCSVVTYFCSHGLNLVLVSSLDIYFSFRSRYPDQDHPRVNNHQFIFRLLIPRHRSSPYIRNATTTANTTTTIQDIGSQGLEDVTQSESNQGHAACIVRRCPVTQSIPSMLPFGVLRWRVRSCCAWILGSQFCGVFPAFRFLVIGRVVSL